MSLPTGTTPGPCPCGSGAAYAECCRPLHEGRPATTAEQLMRSRYTAYAVGDLDHVFRTWHPRTRPSDLRPSPGLTWQGLDVVRVVGGGPEESTGTVEFRARFDGPDGAGVLHETSRFERRAGRWVYVDGDLDPAG